MPKIVIILVILALAFLVQLPIDRGWHGIVPLKSTRIDVERQLGPIDTRCQCYKTENEIVRVTYAVAPCLGDLPGWNVARDTVLSLSVSPLKEVRFSDVEAKPDHFVRTVDDTFTSYYGNSEKGLRYSVSATGVVTNVSYLPSVSDNSRRCRGFPLTDGGITAYSPYQEFPYDSLEDITSRLGEFSIRLQRQPTYKGYIVVYASRTLKPSGVSEFGNRAREYVTKEFGVAPANIVALNGGYREESVVHLFLIPRSWPPPVPNPTFPGTPK